MPQNKNSAQDNYDRFIDRARDEDQVFGLSAPDGSWAVCSSQDDEAVDVVLFWSERASAMQHRKEDWSDYAPTAIPLRAFIEEWLKGMHEDGSLVGPNWDADLSGLELTPEEVAERLVAP